MSQPFRLNEYYFVYFLETMLCFSFHPVNRLGNRRKTAAASSWLEIDNDSSKIFLRLRKQNKILT
jgi:hypothetical protein